MTTQSGQQKKGGLASWSTRDLLVTAVIGIVFGLLTIGLDYISAALIAVNPALVSILSGLYYLPLIMVMYIVRRPGAAVLTILIVELALLPFNPFGWMTTLTSVIFGIACEAPFLLTRYRDFRTRILLISGAAASLLSFAGMFAFTGLSGLTAFVQIGALVLFVVSGVVAGGLAKALADAIAKTGVLDSFAIGQERQEEI
jgi:energy-coupling factor transport system substrate-specific component